MIEYFELIVDKQLYDKKISWIRLFLHLKFILGHFVFVYLTCHINVGLQSKEYQNKLKYNILTKIANTIGISKYEWRTR
jgi:hypothetical protein